MNIENNKLIAEFMGNTPSFSVVDISDYQGDHVLSTGLSKEAANADKSHYDERFSIDSEIIKDELKYHTSWDWLIPVVEKIESLNVVCFEKNLQEEGDYQCLFTKGNDIFICHYADTSKEATHRVVVEFIKWYNEREK
jgi:hypothetical protein